MQTPCNIFFCTISSQISRSSGSSAWQRRPWQRLPRLHLTREISFLEKNGAKDENIGNQDKCHFESWVNAWITVWLYDYDYSKSVQFDCCRTFSAYLTAMNARRTPMGRSQDGDSTLKETHNFGIQMHMHISARDTNGYSIFVCQTLSETFRNMQQHATACNSTNWKWHRNDGQ